MHVLSRLCCLAQAMQAQNMMWVPALATCFAAVVNIPVNLILIEYYGFEGAAAAFSVTRILLFLFLVSKSVDFPLLPPLAEVLPDAKLGPMVREVDAYDKENCDAGLSVRFHSGSGQSRSASRVCSCRCKMPLSTVRMWMFATSSQIPPCAMHGLLRAVYVVFFGQSCYSTRRKGELSGGDSVLQLMRAGLSPETQWAFLQLGFPGGCMMAADASSFDVTTAMAGALGEPSVVNCELPETRRRSGLQEGRYELVAQTWCLQRCHGCHL